MTVCVSAAAHVIKRPTDLELFGYTAETAPASVPRDRPPPIPACTMGTSTPSSSVTRFENRPPEVMGVRLPATTPAAPDPA